jgi:hypothetical protein
MAKVKNQVYDGSEETYTDASGVTHFFGELFRHATSESYFLAADAEAAVTRQSPRGYRDAQKGPGSPKQRPFRECFRLCADRWNALPDECPDNASCILNSSKKNVWEQKQLQGVMCSYYDLFISCCLSFCVEISVYGPDQTEYVGGTIPDSLNCFPCEPPSPCEEVSIAYTTQQMTANQTQQISVAGAQPERFYHWALSGGGTLSATSGTEVTYLAPAQNPNCTENATITLFAEDAACPDIDMVQCDSLTIAINTVTSTGTAVITKSWSGDPGACCSYLPYSCPTHGDPPVVYCPARYCGAKESYTCMPFQCNGIQRGSCTGDACPYIYPPDVCKEHVWCYTPPPWNQSCGQGDPCGTTDKRTVEQKAAGCCPQQLL